MTNIYSNELSDIELEAVSGGDVKANSETVKKLTAVVTGTIGVIAGVFGGGSTASTASTGETHNSDRGMMQEHSGPGPDGGGGGWL